MLTVKDLKEFIKDLPDDMQVISTLGDYESDDPYCGVTCVAVDPYELDKKDVFVKRMNEWSIPALDQPEVLVIDPNNMMR